MKHESPSLPGKLEATLEKKQGYNHMTS